ncbi:MAG: hypothetical protein J6G98_00080 [Bacilli bacterium]|nr:hypothetical protein [Bacilli bacterium]
MNSIDTLKKEIKVFSGNVLGIGDINDELVKKLNDNEAIYELNILSNKSYTIGNASGKGKKISIRNLKKMKKKQVNYLLVDYDKIDEYINTFIKDSIYITHDYIYFVTNNKRIKKLYNRYNVDISEIKCSDKTIYIINTKRAKNNAFKEFFYSIYDYITRIIDIITNLLLS